MKFFFLNITVLLFVAIGQSHASDCPGAARSMAQVLQKPLSQPDTEAELRSIIETCPELAEGHYHLGLSLLGQRKVGEAIKAFQKASELKRDSLFLSALGNAYVEIDKLDLAEKAYDDALRVDQGSSKALQGLSVVYLRQNNLSGAEDVLRRAIQHSPDEAGLFFNLGIILERASRLDEAIESYRAATERQPNYAAAQIHLARVYIASNKFDDAERLLRSASLHDPGNKTLWVSLARVQEERGDFSAALTSLGRARSIDVEDVQILTNEAIVEAKLGKEKESRRKLEDLIKRFPDKSEPRAALGWVLLQTGDFDEAEQQLLRAIELNSKDALSRANLSVLYAKKGDTERSKQQLDLAKQLDSRIDQMTTTDARLEGRN